MTFLMEHPYFVALTSEFFGTIKYDVYTYHVPYQNEKYVGKIHFSSEKKITFCSFVQMDSGREVKNFSSVPEDFKELYGYVISKML